MRLPLSTLAALALLPLVKGGAQPGIPRTSPPAPSSDVFLIPLAGHGATLAAGAPRNISNRVGYDNQPSFSRDGRSVFFTSTREDAQADIYRVEIATGTTSRVTRTAPESEYSAAMTRDGSALHVIRVEADSTQRIWSVPFDGTPGQVLFPDTKPVGYFAQPNDSTWIMFVLGTPVTMHLGYHGRGRTEVVGRNIGRSLHRIPGLSRASIVQKGSTPWQVMEFDPITRKFTPLVTLPAGSEDVAWVDGNTLLVGSGSTLLRWTRGSRGWTELANYTGAGLKNITRLSVSPDGSLLALVAEPQKQQ